jgi:transposase InsO family protein
VHGDLCGPVTPATPGGRRYFLLLIDDLSRYMWVVVLGSKGEAADAIRCMQATAEAECGCKMRVLRTDNGSEFTAVEFASYCMMRVFNATTLCHTTHSRTTSSSSATRRLWGWPGPSSSRGECLLSSGERWW